MRPAIEARNLTKAFDGVTVLSDVDLIVPEGAVFGLVGPSGAGKTTLIRLLTGVLRPTSGTVSLLGRDCQETDGEIRQQVGMVPDDPVFDPFFTVEDLLRFCSRLYRHWNGKRCDELMEQFRLPRDRWIRSLSKGMKTQLALIIALSIRPRLLILDEPTGGLDPLAKSRMFSLILEEVAENGTAVLISSHQLGDLERIIDHVGLLVNGKGVRTWSLDDLKAGARKIQAVFPDGLPEEILRMPEILHVERQGSVFILTTGGGFEKVMANIREHRPVHVETLGLGLEEWLIRKVAKEEWTRAAASSE